MKNRWRGGVTAAPVPRCDQCQRSASLGALFSEWIAQPPKGGRMTEQHPPAWEKDPLSEFLADAEYNTRVTALNLPPMYDLLRRVEGIFRRAGDSIENDSREDLLVPGFLMVRTHSSFLAGTRLAMSGQGLESCPVLRAAVEQAWYALHIAKDPNPPSRVETWLNRNMGAAEKRRCKSEFMLRSVWRTHEEIDPDAARTLHEIYENLIDFGAHPNQSGVMAAAKVAEFDEKTVYDIRILHAEPLAIAWALKNALGVAIGALNVFRTIFPDRFAPLGIDRSIDSFAASANALFTSHSLGDSKQDATNA